MRAILVSVDYSDLLRISLPWNRHHFEQVTVVTSTADAPNVIPSCVANGVGVVVTDLFYADGAKFAKWRALEHGLDVIGRQGWLCLMDADVLLPKTAPMPVGFAVGKLCTPRRRMWDSFPSTYPKEWGRLDTPGIDIPAEASWRQFPLHRNDAEFAGYCQVFHADDPVLGKPPWHDIRWVHAGGADSFFQAKWAPRDKVRPPFEVLHLGQAGQNWMGRVTPYTDGSTSPEAQQRREAVRRVWEGRRGEVGDDRFRRERLGETT